MAYQNILDFTKPHRNGEGGGAVIYMGSGFNGGDLNAVNITAANIDTNRLTANNIDIKSANIKYITSESGRITDLEGNNLNYANGTINNLISTDIKTSTLEVDDTATIKNIINTNLQSENIVTDYLTVNKSAHFFELIIDKMRSIQGTQINTAANCIVDYVEAYAGIYHDGRDSKVGFDSHNIDYYRIYWKNTDDDGRHIDNKWKVYDQALCESFNVHSGHNEDVDNKYYWRLVEATDEGQPVYVNLATGDVVNTAPEDYQITFSTFSYTDTTDPQAIPYTGFTVDPDVEAEWDGQTRTWTVENTRYGLKLLAEDMALSGGSLRFTTNIPTKLNVGVYYDDVTFEYWQPDTYGTTYVVDTAIGKVVESIVIYTDVIDTYDACNWIDLSDIDMDHTLSGKNAIPAIGDNVCQLGYRYDQIQNPTQDDYSRASAIIIAAYETPDSGIVPPSYAQYQGIGSDPNYRWNLAHYRGSYFDAEHAKFIGEFEVDVNGNKTSLDNYIKSFNEANPLGGFISTNNNEPVDLIVLQTDSNSEIHGLNNFPQNMQIMVTYEGSALFDPDNNYDILELTLFGITYNLLDDAYDPDNYVNITDPTRSDYYTGIYLKELYPAHTGMTPAPFRLVFDFNDSNQTISTSTVQLFAQVTNSVDTYTINKSVPINGVSSIKGTDGEVYLLNKITEKSVVESNKSLNTLLRYSINHVKGTNTEIITPTTQKLIIERYNINNSLIDYSQKTVVDYDTTNGYWQYTDTMTNWYNPDAMNNKPYYYVVKLFDTQTGQDVLLFNTIVRVQVDNASFFYVNDGLTNSVQANSDSIAQISQTVDDINLSITDLNDNLKVTGIDIQSGKITLNADNTNVNGTLNVYNDNAGICLYDTSGNLKSQFISRDISGMSDLNFKKVNSINVPITSSNVTFTFELGPLESGRILSISDQYIRFYYQNGGYNEQQFSGSITLLDENDTVVTSGTISNFIIPANGIYKLTMTAPVQYGGIIAEWRFSETLTGSSYLIVGRDGLLYANTNNRLFRVDDNTITLRRQNDGIYLENGSNNTTSLYRLGWNGLNEEKIPFDNFNSFIRLVDGSIAYPGHYDIDINEGGNGYTYGLTYGECGTVIVKAGLERVIKTNIDLYLPSMTNKAPGYTLNIVHAAINNWATQHRGQYVHSLRVHTVDSDFPIYYNGGYYDNVSEGAVLNTMGNYKCIFTGIEWILS